MRLPVATEERHHLAAHLDVLRRRDDGIEALVRRHEAHLATLRAEEALERRLAAHERDDRRAVLDRGARLDHDDVAVEDAVVLHRVALDAERERVAAPEELLRQGDGLRYLDRL